MEWRPTRDLYGIFPMLVGSTVVTAGAIIIGVPIGILTAVFLAEVAPEWLAKIVRPAVELLAGIPSVIYGFFGLLVIVPIIHRIRKRRRLSACSDYHLERHDSSHYCDDHGDVDPRRSSLL